MFVLRLVTLDHYMVAPSAPLDPLVSKLGGWEVWQVPVIRIFGTTPAGQKACLHVHGAMPYLTVPCTESRPERFAVVLASEIDLLLNTAAGRATSMHRHVHHVSVIRATPLYGFHDREQTFLRIFLYNPLHVSKVSELLLSGLVLKRVMQPHEAHVPFTLQFMVDHNLHGMGLVRVDPFKFRRPTCWKPSRAGEGAGTPHSGTPGLWDLHSLPLELFSKLEKQATCELELDCCARDILNAQETEAALNPGLAALWQEEEVRRQEPLMWTPLSVEDEDFPSCESELFYLARLDKLLAKPDRLEQTGAKPKKSHHHILDTSHSGLDSQDEALAEALAQAASSWRQDDEDSILGSQPPPREEEEEEEEEEDMSQVFQLAGGPEEEENASSLSDHSDGDEAYDPFQLDGADDGPPPAAREGCRHQGTQTGVRPPVLVRRLLGRARERRRTRLSLQRPPLPRGSSSTAESTPLSSGASTPYGAGSSTSMTPHSVADFTSVTSGGYTSLSTGGSTPRSAGGSTPRSVDGSTPHGAGGSAALAAEVPSAVHGAGGDSTRDASPAPEDWQRWQSHHVASQLKGPPETPSSVTASEVRDPRLLEAVKLPCWVELVRLSSAEIDQWCRPGQPPHSRRNSLTTKRGRPPRGRRKRGRSTESSAASSPVARSRASSKQCEDSGPDGQGTLGDERPLSLADGQASRAQKQPRMQRDVSGGRVEGDSKKRRRRAARALLASSPSVSADSERSLPSPTPLAESHQGSEEPVGVSNGRPSIICRIRIQGRNRVVVLPPRARRDGDGAEELSGHQPGDAGTSDVPVPSLPRSGSASPGVPSSACSDKNASPSGPSAGLAGLSSEAKSNVEASLPVLSAPAPVVKFSALAKRGSSKKRGPFLGGSPLGGTDTALLVSEFVRLELTDSPTVDSNTGDVNMPSEAVAQMGGPPSESPASGAPHADQSLSNARPATPWSPLALKPSSQALPSGATEEPLVPATSVVSSEGATEQSAPSPLSSANSSPLIIKRRRRKAASSKRSSSSSSADRANVEAADGPARNRNSCDAPGVVTRGAISRGSTPGPSTKQSSSKESCPSASPGLATGPARADRRASSSRLQKSSLRGASGAAGSPDPSTATVAPVASDPTQPSKEMPMRLRRRRESSTPEVPARRSKRRSTFSGTPLVGNVETPDIEDLLSSPYMSRGFDFDSPPSQGLVTDASKPEASLDAADSTVGKLATRGSVKKHRKLKSSKESLKSGKAPSGTKASSANPLTKGMLAKETSSYAEGSNDSAGTVSVDTPSVAPEPTVSTEVTDSLESAKFSLSETKMPVSTSGGVADESQEVQNQSPIKKPLKKVRKNQSVADEPTEVQNQSPPEKPLKKIRKNKSATEESQEVQNQTPTEKPLKKVPKKQSVSDKSQDVQKQSPTEKPLKKVRETRSKVAKSNKIPSASDGEAGDSSASAANARRLSLRKRPPKALADPSSSRASTIAEAGEAPNVEAGAAAGIQPTESDAKHCKSEDTALSSGPLKNSPLGASEEGGPDRPCGASSPVAAQDTTDLDELAAAIAGLNAGFQGRNADDLVTAPAVRDAVNVSSSLSSTPTIQEGSSPSFGASLSRIAVDAGPSRLDSRHSRLEASDSSSPAGITNASEVRFLAQSGALSNSSQVDLPDPVEEDKPKDVLGKAGSPVLESGPLFEVEGKVSSTEPVAQAAAVKTSGPVAVTALSDDADAVQKVTGHGEGAGTSGHGGQASRSPQAGVVSGDMSLSDSLACLLDSSAADMFFLPSQSDGTGLDLSPADDEGDKSTSKPKGREISKGPARAKNTENEAESTFGPNDAVEANLGSEAVRGGTDVVGKKDPLDSWPDNSSELLNSGDLAKVLEAEEPEDEGAGSSPEGSGSVHTVDEVSDDCVQLGSEDDGWVLLDEAKDESVELFASSEDAAGSSPGGSAEHGSESGGEDIGHGDEAGEIETANEDTGGAEDVADAGGVSSARGVDSEDVGRDTRARSGEDVGSKDHGDAAFDEDVSSKDHEDADVDDDFADETGSQDFGKDNTESSGENVGSKDHGDAALDEDVGSKDREGADFDEDFADETCSQDLGRDTKARSGERVGYKDHGKVALDKDVDSEEHGDADFDEVFADEMGFQDFGKDNKEGSGDGVGNKGTGEAAVDKDFTNDACPENTEVRCEPVTGAENAKLEAAIVAMSTKVPQVEVTRLDDVDAESELGLLFARAKQALTLRKRPSGEAPVQQSSCRKPKEAEGFTKDIDRASTEATEGCQKRPRKDLSLSSRQKTSGKGKQTDQVRGGGKGASKHQKGYGQQGKKDRPVETPSVVEGGESVSAETTLEFPKASPVRSPASGQQAACDTMEAAGAVIDDEECASVEGAVKCQQGPCSQVPSQQCTCDNTEEAPSVMEEEECASEEGAVKCQEGPCSQVSSQQSTCDNTEAPSVIEEKECASVEGAVKCEPCPQLSSQQSTLDDAEDTSSVIEEEQRASVKEALEHLGEPLKDPLETSHISAEDAGWAKSGAESALAFSCEKVSLKDTSMSGNAPSHSSMPCAQAQAAAWGGGDVACAPSEIAYPPDEPAAEAAKVPGLFEQSLDLSELPDALERLLGTVPLPELDADCFSLGSEPANWLAAERNKPTVEAKEELLEEDSVLRDLAQGCSLTNEGLVALVPAQPPPPRCGLLPRDGATARKRSLRRGFAFWQKAKLEAFASASCFEVDFEHNPELRIAFCRDRTVVLTPARCPPSSAWLARQPRPDENGGSPGKLTPGEAALLDSSTPPATPPTVLPATPPADSRDASVDTPSKHEASSSQLDGPTARFALSSARLPADAVEERGRALTLLSLEVHVRTRGELRPDPAQDPVLCVLWYARGGALQHRGAPRAGALYWLPSGGDPRLAEGTLLLLPRTGVTGLQGEALRSERELLAALVELVARWDPDVLLGYDVERGSWGYLCERAQHLDVDLRAQLSRAPPRGRSSDDIVGRILLSVWRILRKEVALNVYTFENTYYHVMHHRVPLYSFRTLTDWFAQDLFRWRTVEHFAVRARGNVELLDELDVLGKTSEMARIYGIQFLEVLSRGSQFRVESMLLRLARARRLVALSPSSGQRARQRAPEFVPLILEPRAQLYTDPVVVLDFQSLYPSVIIAHNYCFSTCLGRVDSLGTGGAFPFGCSMLEVHPALLKTLRGHISVSPAGVAFVRPSIRRGLLPQMLNEVLGTRLMVKGAMSRCTDKALRRVLEAQQLGLKLLANVTYGYTAAGFSGRMPCVEVADSVVSKGREALERAIRTVESTVPGARVIYGDTDSLFVLLEGRTRQEAFELGQQMADRVTADNPRPMRLRMEKVYQPCVLQTKKRYVGFAYEHPDQEEPKYDAKGIETVRRDTCPAVAKMLEKMLRVLFASRDVGAVKRFVKLQFSKILAERVSPQDFVFAREFRGLTGYQPGACVPALEIAQRLVRRDPRAEPLVGERVPYLVVYGHPGQRLIELVRQPSELLRQTSQWRLNAHYYVQRVIGPALNRVLRLLGADCLQWYEELPRPRFVTPTTHPGRLSSYLVVGQLCLACGGQAEARQLCGSCEADPSYTALVLGSKVQRVQKALLELQSVCRSCMGFQADSQPPPCVSVDCPVLYKLARVTGEAQQAVSWHNSNSGSVRLHLPLS